MKLKKFLLTVLAICLVVGFTGTASAAVLSDINGHWAEQQVKSWVGQGLVAGYPDGTFKPDREISRAEFVALINRSFQVQMVNSELDFVDVSKTDWFYENLAAAKVAGYISGYQDHTFKPYQEISRQEAAVIITKLLHLDTAGALSDLNKFTDAAAIPAWSKAYLNTVIKAGIFKGYPDGTVKPLRPITRAEAIVVLTTALAGQQGGQEQPEGQEEEADLQGIEGTVTYDRKEVKNAVIQVFEKDGYEVIKETETDGSGYFKLALSPGVYDLTVSTKNAVAYAGDISVAKDESVTRDFTLQDAAVISGKLYAANNKAAADVEVMFTTNPTFVTTTDENGNYKLAVLPDRKYKVRVVNPENNKVEVVKESVDVGSAGQQQNVDSMHTSFDADTSASSGGGGSTEPAESVVNSVTIMVNNSPVTINGKNNVFTVDLTGYDEKDMFTKLTVNASEDVVEAEVALMGVTRKININQGHATVTVRDLLGELDKGEDGISLSSLRNILDIIGDSSLGINLTGANGTKTVVTVNINLP